MTSQMSSRTPNLSVTGRHQDSTTGLSSIIGLGDYDGGEPGALRGLHLTVNQCGKTSSVSNFHGNFPGVSASPSSSSTTRASIKKTTSQIKKYSINSRRMASPSNATPCFYGRTSRIFANPTDSDDSVFTAPPSQRSVSLLTDSIYTSSPLGLILKKSLILFDPLIPAKIPSRKSGRGQMQKKTTRRLSACSEDDKAKIKNGITETMTKKRRCISKSTRTSRSPDALRRWRRSGKATALKREIRRPRCIALRNLVELAFDRIRDFRRWQSGVDDGLMLVRYKNLPTRPGDLRRRVLLRESSSWPSLRRL